MLQSILLTFHMGFVYLFIFALLTNSQHVSPHFIRSPRLRNALNCDLQCKNDLHECLDDISDECMRSCARGLTLENKASITVGEWFDCYHSCISKAGIRCFVTGGECLMICKDDALSHTHHQGYQPVYIDDQSSFPPSSTTPPNNSTSPSFMQRRSFDLDFSSGNPLSAPLYTDVGSAQLYHNIKVEIDRRTRNIMAGNPSALNGEWTAVY